MPDLDPQVIIIFIVMLVSGVRWLIEKVNAPKPGEYEEFEDPNLEDAFEQQREKILARQRRKLAQQEKFKREQTTGSPQAPPPVPQQIPPRRSQVPQQRQQVPQQAPKQVQRPVLSKAEKEALARVQESSLQGGIGGASRASRPKRRGTGQSVVDLLHSPNSARDAILLAEVLGKPKGAQ